MKHKHYDKIVAKAANMELVVFTKIKSSEKWEESSLVAFIVNEHFDFFLCLPKHKEACLHWLNGGDIQVMDSNWINVHPVESYPWEDEHDFMCEDSKIRIKPKKEKRLIVYRNGVVYGPYLSIDDINTDFVLTGQVVEIEVEV